MNWVCTSIARRYLLQNSNFPLTCSSKQFQCWPTKNYEIFLKRTLVGLFITWTTALIRKLGGKSHNCKFQYLGKLSDDQCESCSLNESVHKTYFWLFAFLWNKNKINIMQWAECSLVFCWLDTGYSYVRKGITIENMFPSNWPVGQQLGHFLY